jgi:UDP-glucose 4-epimerase
MAWLITGGAGYIGAHVVRDMLATGREVVVLDDLSTGRAERVPEEVPLVVGATMDRRAVRSALTDYDITGVMHFAARKAVGESVSRPLYYWEQNIGGLQVLAEEMATAGIHQMVFSSSAAVYGQPRLEPNGGRGAERLRITEETHCLPINPYGATKLAGEWLVAGAAAALGWTVLSLRYFNVAGAGSPTLGDPAVLNLIPLVFQALERGERPRIFGDDYATPDGTCIRDYIHVSDLSAAHVAAARLVEASATGQVFPSDRAAVDAARRAAEVVQSAAHLMPGGSRVVGASATVMESAVGRLRGAVAGAAELAAGVAPGVGMAAQLGSIANRVARGSHGEPVGGHLAVNVGTGQGASVREVMSALRVATGRNFDVEIVPRRAGDPPALVASPELARKVLGWRSRHNLAEIAASAWEAWRHDH